MLKEVLQGLTELTCKHKVGKEDRPKVHSLQPVTEVKINKELDLTLAKGKLNVYCYFLEVYKQCQITEKVAGSLRQFDASKMGGAGEIHLETVKMLVGVVIKPFVQFFNALLDEGSLPENWLASYLYIKVQTGVTVSCKPLNPTCAVLEILASIL